MVARVSDLLQEADEIKRLGRLLLDSPDTNTDKQRECVEKIISNAVNFSSLVTEKTDILESGSHHIHTMSHELRTPITSMLTQAYMLIKYLYVPLTEIQREYLTEINSRAKKLADLIDSMMNDAIPWQGT